MTTSTSGAWPALPWHDWQPTLDTVHMWTQIVGKIRLALSPPQNHWWHIALYVTSRGLSTSPMPYENRYLEIEFDFLSHQLHVTDSDGGAFDLALEPRSVADLYSALMAGLCGIGIDVTINTSPVEVVRSIPFELDEEHASYDRDHAQALWRGMLQADRVMKRYQSGFAGKASPVHFFWGSFDLATTRFSGHGAPLHPGGAPNCANWVMEEAYSREQASVGWWPSHATLGPAFYAYTYPEPAGIRSATVKSEAAYFDHDLGEFVLAYDFVRAQADPDATAIEFFESTYLAGAELANWNRRSLEPTNEPETPPSQPWTLAHGAVDALP